MWILPWRIWFPASGISPKKKTALMAQLVDALSWGGRQCEFDSHSEHQEINAPVDKLAKSLLSKGRVLRVQLSPGVPNYCNFSWCGHSGGLKSHWNRFDSCRLHQKHVGVSPRGLRHWSLKSVSWVRISSPLPNNPPDWKGIKKSVDRYRTWCYTRD